MERGHHAAEDYDISLYYLLIDSFAGTSGSEGTKRGSHCSRIIHSEQKDTMNVIAFKLTIFII